MSPYISITSHPSHQLMFGFPFPHPTERSYFRNSSLSSFLFPNTKSAVIWSFLPVLLLYIWSVVAMNCCRVDILSPISESDEPLVPFQPPDASDNAQKIRVPQSCNSNVADKEEGSLRECQTSQDNGIDRAATRSQFIKKETSSASVTRPLELTEKEDRRFYTDPDEENGFSTSHFFQPDIYADCKFFFLFFPCVRTVTSHHHTVTTRGFGSWYEVLVSWHQLRDSAPFSLLVDNMLHSLNSRVFTYLTSASVVQALLCFKSGLASTVKSPNVKYTFSAVVKVGWV